MDGLITEIKTITRSGDDILRARKDKPSNPGPETRDHAPSNVSSTGPASSADILSILRSNPGQDELSRAISILDPFWKGEVAVDFDIRVPSPKTAQILNALVTITVPDHWDPLNTASKGPSTEYTKLRAAILRCLSSVSGISCLVTQLRSLIAQRRASSQQADASGSGIRIRNILEVTSALLEPQDFVLRLRADIDTVYKNDMQKQVAWKELLSLIAVGRVLSTAAEALSLASESDASGKLSWLGNGSQYASWLGANICHMASKLAATSQGEQWKALAALTGRALSLGYTDQLVREIYSGLLVNQPLTEQYAALFNRLRWTEQLAVLEAIFRDIEKKHLLTGSTNGDTASDQPVDSIAALCSILLSKQSNLESQLIDWLSKGQGGSIQTPALRRALIVNLAYQKDLITTLLSKSLEQSADKIYIQHAPLRSQEANTQVILLAAGYLNRLDAGEMMSIGRTGVFLNAVSNRLAAASTRARFLGMLVGTAISQLIEEPGKAMRFDLEEMESTEAEWYLSLTRTEDCIGSLEPIKMRENIAAVSELKLNKGSTFSSSSRPFRKAGQTATSKIVAIEELSDSDEEEDEDEDLIPYEKPDEDPSDSDDDPTLVQRNKPTAPVYIRDLVAALRDTDNLDRHELAIAAAPALIRRKTGFGTELAEHTEELALVVVGLQEQSKLPKFHEQRLQSMIALIVSQPLKMAQWFTAVFFDGDLSQVQRSAVLTALGLSARELAGVGADDAKALGLPAIPDSSFPSKKLPSSLEAIYSSDESPIAAITRGIAQASLQPLAAEAADNLSGPNALKVRTFSSRMEVEKRRQQREAHRQKSTVKDLYKVLTEGFFYPLTGRFEIMMLQFTSSTAPSHNPFFVPHLLALFIQTLTLVLSTMGPHTPFLPSVTQQTLTFLLSLHARPVSEEPTILSALLSLFLAMIDMNVESGTSGEERLVTEFATQVMELREWAGEIFDRTPAVRDSSDPREQIRTLSAGVMVKLGEVMERYQGRLMGVNSGFKY
ncbi:telomere length regulation protein-domain-containing protein [Aspergillus germanicus]